MKNKFTKTMERLAAIVLAGMLITGCGGQKTASGAAANKPAETTGAQAGSVSEKTDAKTESVSEKTDAKEDTADTAAAEAAEDGAEEDLETADSEANAGKAQDGEAAGEADQIIELEPDEKAVEEAEATIAKDGVYYSKDDVALYLHTYHELPSNYITKKEAKKLGWEGGKLEPYAPGMAIGGDYFGNYEGILPQDEKYHECDIDTKGKSRGAKRIVYSDTWNIYYTEDHYESFELLYSEDGEAK